MCRCVAPACIPNKIADPLLFYTNVCGNVEKAYTRDELDSRLKADAWRCKCGAMATGKFCPECGSQKPADEDGWTCSCGALNKGKFCQSCGAKKPEGAPLYRCDKCGWEPEDPTNPPKFCPECGDIFDDNDKK